MLDSAWFELKSQTPKDFDDLIANHSQYLNGLLKVFNTTLGGLGEMINKLNLNEELFNEIVGEFMKRDESLVCLLDFNGVRCSWVK